MSRQSVAGAIVSLFRNSNETQDHVITLEEGEALLLEKMEERRTQFYQGQTRPCTFHDILTNKTVTVDVAEEDYLKVESYITRLTHQPAGIIYLDDQQFTLYDLATLGMFLNKEVGIYIYKSQRTVLIASTTNSASLHVGATIRPPEPCNDYKIYAHFHPTLSDDKSQLTDDMKNADNQLEVVINAQRTIMVYREGHYYNATRTNRLISRLMTISVREAAHVSRPYLDEIVRKNAPRKIGKFVDNYSPTQANESEDDGLFGNNGGLDVESESEPEEGDSKTNRP